MSSGKSEILYLDGLLLSLKNDEKFKEKLACSFKHDKEFGEFSPSRSKV